ncbi:VTC domain protein [compost metagenome]
MQFNGKRLRHELKYYISHNEYEGLRKRIRPLLPLDRNSIGDQGYHIRSLYFDDIHENALFDKNNGIFQRKKYRIRIYNVSDKVIKLERKSKFNEYVAKESISLTREQVDRLLGGDSEWLRGLNQQLAQDFYWDLKQGIMKPSVIVDYIREAYIESISDTRITFDKELASGLHANNLFDDQLATWQAVEGPKMILEVKFNQYLPASIRELLQMSAHQRSTISKYVLCKERQKMYLS